MRAWRVNADFSRALLEQPERTPPPNDAAIRMQAAPVLSYLKQVIECRLGYSLPPAPFTPGTNAIGLSKSPRSLRWRCVLPLFDKQQQRE
jgi:alcohol dehydrogenase